MTSPARVVNTETDETLFTGTEWECMEWALENYPNDDHIKVGKSKD